MNLFPSSGTLLTSLPDMDERIRDSDYRMIRDIVYSHSRINLGDHRQELVMMRIRKRMRALGLTSIHEYCRRLRKGADPEEITQLVDVTTTNHTYFFREPDHFDYLFETILPASENHPHPKRNWNILSAACSSGEEVYSLAIVLAESLGLGVTSAWKIHGVDISGTMIDKARQGVYPEDRVSQSNPALLRKYFTTEKAKNYENKYRIVNPLRERVSFECANLLESELHGDQTYDVIFCRNVLIYFDRPTQQMMLERLLRKLVPGGYLFVGHAEGLSALQLPLKLIKPSIFRYVF